MEARPARDWKHLSGGQNSHLELIITLSGAHAHREHPPQYICVIPSMVTPCQGTTKYARLVVPTLGLSINSRVTDTIEAHVLSPQ